MRGARPGVAPGPPFLGLPPFSQQLPAKLSTNLTLSQPAFCVCVVPALEVGLLQRPGALLREVPAAEEGLEAGVGADPGGVWARAQDVCVPGAHVYAVPFRVAAALVAACGMSVGFLPWASSHKSALDRVVLPPC